MGSNKSSLKHKDRQQLTTSTDVPIELEPASESAKVDVNHPTHVPIQFVPSYHHHHLPINNGDDSPQEENLLESPYPTTIVTAPAAVFQPYMAARSNRILVFHSKASWSGYFECSKAITNLVVAYFATPWYQPCRYMEPILKKIAGAYGTVEFVKIDVDELYDISMQFGVRTTPTFMFIKKGKVVDKVVGARVEELQIKIKMHGVYNRTNAHEPVHIHDNDVNKYLT